MPAANRVPSINHRRGFTLIELSIVLVIIGLIIGAIAVGRDLVQATKIRMAVAQIEKYKTAVNTFRTKYNAIPGDMTQDQADDAGFTVPPTRTDSAYMTHGNGLLEDLDSSYSTNAGTYFFGEGLEFWEDLSSAGLIAGQFTKATEAFGSGGPQKNLTPATLGGFVPASLMGNNNWVVAYGIYGDSQAGTALPPVLRGNYFQLTGISSTDGNASIIAENDLTPTQAQNIDTKIDDGVFDTGTVRASNHVGRIYVNLFSALNNTCTLYAYSGINLGYQTAAYPDTPACQLSFKF